MILIRFLKRAARRLQGLVGALPGRVVLPSMVGAAQPILIRDAVPKAGRAMGAALADATQVAAAIPLKDEVLPEDADPGGRGSPAIAPWQRHGVPVVSAAVCPWRFPAPPASGARSLQPSTCFPPPLARA